MQHYISSKLEKIIETPQVLEEAIRALKIKHGKLRAIGKEELKIIQKLGTSLYPTLKQFFKLLEEL